MRAPITMTTSLSPPNGCATSSRLVLSQTAMSTSAQSETSKPPTSSDIRNAISSPASADGTTPSSSLDGQTTKKYGPAHVHVSRFRARDSEKDMPTNDTS